MRPIEQIQALNEQANGPGVWETPRPKPASDHVALKTKNVCTQYQTDGCDGSRPSDTILQGVWMCRNCAEWFLSPAS